MNRTAKGNFITRDHPYVYLGGSLIALLGLSLLAGESHPLSFLTDNPLPDHSLGLSCTECAGFGDQADQLEELPQLLPVHDAHEAFLPLVLLFRGTGLSPCAAGSRPAAAHLYRAALHGA